MKTNPPHFLVAAAAVAVVSLSLAACAGPRGTRPAPAVKRVDLVTRDMTPSQVEWLIGPPERTEQLSRNESRAYHRANGRLWLFEYSGDRLVRWTDRL
ncbi:MAG: hypothetical protein KDM91_03180 [Verrucomicrobiae bacterium]|nr:hypothetical protein [Verrucomicrobiae bacterium]MCP5540227.1 hypothetical protein [Akkermansiaceae bacterium]MCP5551162.1 hypothetical protein [Akkermansiaceae bacterium]